MEKARINIKVVEKGDFAEAETRLEGPTYLIMYGLTNAIKELETEIPEEDRADFRIRILKMLNDRD